MEADDRVVRVGRERGLDHLHQRLGGALAVDHQVAPEEPVPAAQHFF